MHVIEEPKSFLIIYKNTFKSSKLLEKNLKFTSCSDESDESALKSRFELLDPLELLFVIVLRLVIVF